MRVNLECDFPVSGRFCRSSVIILKNGGMCVFKNTVSLDSDLLAAFVHGEGSVIFSQVGTFT